MLKIFFFSIFFSIFFSLNSFGAGFEGCGEYLFKGILRPDKSASNKIVYIVYEGTRSQMDFSILGKKDLDNLLASINQSTEFKGKIVKQMNGTKGEVSELREIKLRFANPLHSGDTGIKKIQSFSCL